MSGCRPAVDLRIQGTYVGNDFFIDSCAGIKWGHVSGSGFSVPIYA